MNTSIAKDIWTLMNAYDFEVDPDSINEDMSCTICKKLMANPYRGICGCQYCHKCITEYVGDCEKYCPGNKLKCTEEYLSLDTDIIKDIRMHNKIVKVIAICPNGSCKSRIELKEMHEHLRVCSKQSTKCPYITIGCENKEMTKENIEYHLNNEIFPHAQLLLEYIHNMNNEVEGMKLNFEMSKSEIVLLKEDSKIKDNRISELEELRNGMELRLSAMMEERANINRETEERIIEISKVQNKEIINQLNEQKREIKLLRAVKSEIEVINGNGLRGNDLSNSCWNDKYDYIWKIDGLETKRISMRNEDIFSKSFYSKNYNLCLCININDNDDICILCVIMKGANDNGLRWPMRHGVTLSIIDQNTLKPYKSVTLRYDTYEDGFNNGDKRVFLRPKKDYNWVGIGQVPFIHYSTIAANPSIVSDDSIVVSCILTDP